MNTSSKKKEVQVTQREEVVTFLADPDITYVSLVRHGANNTPFRIVKGYKGGAMNKIIQAVMVPKDSKVDIQALMGKDIRNDLVEEEGDHKYYVQVEKSACIPDSKSLVLVDKDKQIYAVTYDLVAEKGTVQKDTKAIPFSAHGKVGTSTSAWDASKARKQFKAYAKKEDGETDFSKYKKGFTLLDGEADNLGSYKLPTHFVSDGKIVSVWKGVTSAMGALHGARSGGMGLPDDVARGVYNHLAKEYALFDEEAPEFKSVFDGTIEKSAIEEQEPSTENALIKDVSEVSMYEVWEELMAMSDVVTGAMSQSARSETDRKKTVLAAIDNFRSFTDAVFTHVKATDVYVPEKKLGEQTIKGLATLQEQVSKLLNQKKEGGTKMFEFPKEEDAKTFVQTIVDGILRQQAESVETAAKIKTDQDAAKAAKVEFEGLKKTVDDLSKVLEKLAGVEVGKAATADPDTTVKTDKTSDGKASYVGAISGLRRFHPGISAAQ